MSERKANVMTEWDAGQVLISVQDHLSEAVIELAEVNPKAASELNRMRLQVGDLFNERHANNSHYFGLAGNTPGQVEQKKRKKKP